MSESEFEPIAHPIKDEGGQIVSADDKYATTAADAAEKDQAALDADPNPSDAGASESAAAVAEQGPGNMIGQGAGAPTGPVNGDPSIVAATAEARDAAEAKLADSE